MLNISSSFVLSRLDELAQVPFGGTIFRQTHSRSYLLHVHINLNIKISSNMLNYSARRANPERLLGAQFSLEQYGVVKCHFKMEGPVTGVRGEMPYGPHDLQNYGNEAM